MTDGLLNKLKVVELCSFVAGPYCTKLFADFGAEVIKIEQPGGAMRQEEGDHFCTILLIQNSRGSFSISIPTSWESPLTSIRPTGRELFKKMIADADILVEDRPPGEMEKLGLNYEVLKEINPSLIMASITPIRTIRSLPRL